MTIIRHLLALVFALGLVALTADARSPVKSFGGAPRGPGGGGLPSSCDTDGTGVCALFQDGQTFVTWNDMAPGTSGNAWRYTVVRSLAPITSGNWGAATPIGAQIINNSAQLWGGNPFANQTESSFTQLYHQDVTASRPMTRLTAGGTPLPRWSGLQVHTALGTENAYYAVIGTSGGVDTYIGSVGAIAESVLPIQPIKVADSLDGRSGTTQGKILHTSSATKARLLIYAHGSSVGLGCVEGSCSLGDYWEVFQPNDASNWAEGRPTAYSIGEYTGCGVGNCDYWAKWHDAVEDPLGTYGMETLHWGLGMSPLAVIGPPNRQYPFQRNAIWRMIDWTCGHYVQIDCTSIYWTGISMGSWGSQAALRKSTSPRVSAVFVQEPIWQRWKFSSGSWAAPGTWTSAQPFRATNNAVTGAPTSAPSTLGTVATQVLDSDGNVWGGTSGSSDDPHYVATHPAQEFPFMTWATTSWDRGEPTFDQHIAMVGALEAVHAGYAMGWSVGDHNDGNDVFAAIDCAQPPVQPYCYAKTKFRTDLPYIAFSNSSINDDMGTGGLLPNGLYDASLTGVNNVGFSWNVTTDTSGTLAFTVDNTFMNHAPTTHPQSTLTSPLTLNGGGTFTVADNVSIFKSLTWGNRYWLIGGDEVIQVANSLTGNTVTISFRCRSNTVCRTHAIGETVMQISELPDGPNAGPFATMTVDMTPRRLQNFIKANGTTVTCTATPDLGSPTTFHPVVANGLFTLPGVVINATGATVVSCS